MADQKKNTPAVAPESPPHKLVVVCQDGSKEDVDASGGLVTFAVAKDGKVQMRVAASRGQMLNAARTILQMLSEAHIALCSVTQAGGKCAEGMKFDSADLLVAELTAIGAVPQVPMPPPGTTVPTGANSPLN